VEQELVGRQPAHVLIPAQGPAFVAVQPGAALDDIDQEEDGHEEENEPQPEVIKSFLIVKSTIIKLISF